ncbi:hypothetical protein MVEN_02024700 [Mycena venus]|uniref:Uncharacterized protein n=1 Tax=Mycena venus TaxID=2733690 RepID=A0A8H7CJV0_9AGAR|nr:hypothetical protein MVEN_02024700 [Mycena venus]
MTLQIFGGHLGIPVVLLTAAFSKKVQRHPVLISFLATWVIYATPFTLVKLAQSLPYSSAYFKLPSYMESQTPMAGLALVLHLWFSLVKGATGRWSIVPLASPYILFIVVSVTMAVIGSLNPETVSRSRSLLYCNINVALVDAVPGTAGIIMLTSAQTSCVHAQTCSQDPFGGYCECLLSTAFSYGSLNNLQLRPR